MRYLDLRVYLDDDNIFYLIHGLEVWQHAENAQFSFQFMTIVRFLYPGFVIVPQANPFYEELAAVKDFVEQNPTEVVVLDMNHIYRYKGV